MKKMIWALSLFALVLASCIVYVPTDGPRAPQRGPYDDQQYSRTDRKLDIGYFYDYLSPYGTWVRMGRYGHVWVPRHMGYRWRPYMHGRWAWTDDGWFWISDETWGWLPFHYGRWGWSDDIGWFWVPGTIWAPSWVVWRYGGPYFGWAPLPPDVLFEPRYGLRSFPQDLPYHWWNFCEGRDFLAPRLYERILPVERNITLIRVTVNRAELQDRNGRVVNEGLDVGLVRRATGQAVDRRLVRSTTTAGPDRIDSREVTVFRPQVREDAAAAPKEIINESEARERLGEAGIYEPSRSGTSGDDVEVVRRRHVEEVRILEKSQAEEIRVVERRRVETGRVQRTTAEREKARVETEKEVVELKKRHVDEKKALDERQKKDREVVTRRVVRKK